MKRKLLCLIISTSLLWGCEKNDEKPFRAHLFAFRSVGVSSNLLIEFDTIMKTSRIVSDTLPEITEYIDANEYVPSRESFYSILDDGSKTSLSSFSVKDGELISELPLEFNVPFLGLHYDQGEDLFYALQISEDPVLVSIDPQTADLTTISSSALDFAYLPGDYSTALCPDKNLYAFISNNDMGNQSLTIIDISSGNIVDSFPLAESYTGLFYLPSSNNIYCLRQDDLFDFSFGFFDINTGGFTVQKEHLINGDLSHVAFDPVNKLYAIIYNDPVEANLVIYDFDKDIFRDILKTDKGYITLNFR